MTPRQSSSLLLAPLLGLAACSLGIQVGQVTAGGSTSSGSPMCANPLCLGGETGDATTTASFPDPCEIDLDFGNVPIGLIDGAVVQIDSAGSGTIDLSQLMPTLDPEFGLKAGTEQPIQPGNSGQLTVTFQPYKVGQVTSTFTIPTNGVNPHCPAVAGGGDSVLTVELIGTGIDLSLVVEPDVLDFGNVLINTTAKESVTLINKSTAAVTGITATISGADAKLFRVDNCPVVLGAGVSATVTISYSPLALETRSTAFVIFSGSDGEMLTLNLLGEPVGVALTLAPNPCDFGYVPLMTTAVCCTTVSNQANVSVNVTGTSDFANEGGAFALATTDDATPPNPYSFPTTANPLTLNGGDSAKICFQFSPPISQQYSGQVTLATTDPSGTNPVLSLTGWGGGPQITCAPTSLDFGPVVIGKGSTLPVTCTNTGSAIPAIYLIIEPPTVSPAIFDAEFDQTVNVYPLTGLAPGESAQIDVTYTPAGPTSPPALDAGASNDTGTLFIRNNGGKGTTIQIPLTGQGTDGLPDSGPR